MECLQIDWKNIDATFEPDEFYESIQAPKWIDFTAPLQPVDDHDWFCGKAGCTHMKETSWQPPEAPLLTDPQETSSFQTPKKGPPLTENNLSSVAPGKRVRGAVSSSYSSLSSIKEAFAKHKSLHGTKLSSVAESNKHAMKRSVHASENQNPNQACGAPPVVSKIPTLKASEVLAKKPKTMETKHLSGKSESSLLSGQIKRPQCRPALDVMKSSTFIGKKDLMQKKSTTSCMDVKEHESAASAMASYTSEFKNKKVEATAKMPFSVYSMSRCALTSSSLGLPPRRPTIPARSMQNVRLANDRSASCRPPRVVVRKDHKVGVERAQKSEDNAVLLDANLAPRVDGLGHVEPNANQLPLHKQYSSIEHDVAADRSLMLNGNSPHTCEEGEDNGKVMPAQITLEQHLESLSLSTPGSKLASHGVGHLEHTMQVAISHSNTDELHHADELEMGRSQFEHIASMCKSGAEHEEVLLTDFSNSRQSMDYPHVNETPVIGTNSDEMNGSFVDCMHITEENDLRTINKVSERKDNQLQPVMDWQRNRGLKRKSSELNFKVNCSAKDHRHESHKVSSSVVFGSSLLCQQAKQVSIVRSSMRAPPCLESLDSCKEQHKKIKTTKVQQPIKPFRLRTEERCALKGLGLGKKEQGVSGVSNPQELVHHALRMPSFGHPFRPQRSTKKLTIPKEPNFHSAKPRKACARGHHTAMIMS